MIHLALWHSIGSVSSSGMICSHQTSDANAASATPLLRILVVGKYVFAESWLSAPRGRFVAL